MEEDIKRISNLIEYIKNADYVDASQCFDGEDIQAIENLLTRYKQLEEENKNYINPSKARTSYYDTKKGIYVMIEGYIPKHLVKEKIEELKEQRRNLGFKTYLRREDMLNDDRAIACEIAVLEELLREE